jgi:hypothetical protein
MGAGLGDALALIFLVAVIYVLVRPQSKAASAVAAVTDMVTAMVRRATDLAT